MASLPISVSAPVDFMPEDYDYRIQSYYIKQGKTYPIVQHEDEHCFFIIDEDGQKIFCTYKKCGHIFDADWIKNYSY